MTIASSSSSSSTSSSKSTTAPSSRPESPAPSSGESTSRSAVLEPEEMVDLRGDDDEDDFNPSGMRDLAVSMGVDRSTPEKTTSFRESSLDSFSAVDSDEDGFLTGSEYRSAMGNEASAEDAAAAIVGLESSETIQGYSNDEWFRENDGPTEADLEASGEAEEVRFQQELSRQKLRDGQQFADDVPHDYDSVYGAEPTESQKVQIGKRGVTTAELEEAYRTEDERAAGLTVIDRAVVVDGKAQPGLDRTLVVSAPQDADGRVTADDAISDGLVGEGTEHDDIVRLVRAYDTGGPDTAERTNKIIKGEAVQYVGPLSTYQTNSDINADHDQHGAPQFTEEGAYRGEATPLGSDINLALGGGSNTVYIDQPINITGHPAEHLTTIEGTPNGMDTYNFDEGLMTREVMPVDVIYNGESLFSLRGDQVESLDAIDISQAEGGTSRFRVPTNRMPVLNQEHPLVQSGQLRYEGEYLVIAR